MTAGSPTPPFSRWERTLAGRYLRARREHGGVALISIISFSAIMLAVAALIIVMSVMNGFRAELLSRILGVNGHMFVQVQDMPEQERLALAARLKQVPGIEAVRPMITGQVMVLGSGSAARGAVVQGVDPGDLEDMPLVANQLVGGSLETFGKGEAGEEEIAIGSRLAGALGVVPGDWVELISPEGSATAFGVAPRSKEYRVGAVFDIGMSEYDETLIYMPLSQAQPFFNRGNGVDTLDLRVADPDATDALFAPVTAAAPGRIISDWKTQSESLVSALGIERNVMRLILSIVLAIAALNIISGLVMLVKNKTRDIAVLRSMGATEGAILRIFIMAGAAVGVLGTLAGVTFGTLFCLNIEAIQRVVEVVFGPVFNADVYFLSQIPAKVEWSEVITTAVFALVMSVLVTLPPAWRAARLQPVEALRYE
jgi:lipoprotein-releasing system permease protein